MTRASLRLSSGGGFLALAFWTVAAALPAALRPKPPADTHSLSLPGMPVEFVFRALQPGEAVLAVLKDAPAVKGVRLEVRGQTYVLGAPGPGRAPFALFGIDVQAKADPLPVRILEEKADGSLARFAEDLGIEPREFSKRRFWVDEAMLNPPSQEQERVAREADLVQSVFDILTPEWLGTGGFQSPLPDREPFPNFGQLRLYNKTRQSVHAGVDIGAPWGEAVHASNAGRVVLASRLYLSGGTVIIDHGLGVFTFYCHFSKILVKRGDVVGKGQVIARVGNTGRSTGPHLHWAVRIRDVRVDPFSLVGLPLD